MYIPEGRVVAYVDRQGRLVNCGPAARFFSGIWGSADFENHNYFVVEVEIKPFNFGRNN